MFGGHHGLEVTKMTWIPMHILVFLDLSTIEVPKHLDLSTIWERIMVLCQW